MLRWKTFIHACFNSRAGKVDVLSISCYNYGRYGKVEAVSMLAA
jgi:hypothetical protein